MVSAHDSNQAAVSDEGKKAKRRYSKGTKGIQTLERAFAESLERVSEGITETLGVYNKKADKSSRKRRDGALRDGLQNWAAAAGKGVSVAAEAPEVFMKAVNKGPGTKSLRKIVLSLVPPQLR